MDEATVISEYSLEQAIEDGVLVAWQKDYWQFRSDGKPIVVTSDLFDCVSLPDLHDLWNKFIVWKKNSILNASDSHHFVTTLNEKRYGLSKTNRR